MDLATYTPMGDKKNSDFFNEYLPRIYERREQAGLNQIVGNMAAVVVQVEHGDAVNYLAELAVMGPYRLVEARIGETHRYYVLKSQPEFPRLIVLEPLTPGYEDNITRWNLLYPLGQARSRIAATSARSTRPNRSRRCARRWSRTTSASPTPERR